MHRRAEGAICNGLSPVLPAVTASTGASRIETQSLLNPSGATPGYKSIQATGLPGNCSCVELSLTGTAGTRYFKELGLHSSYPACPSGGQARGLLLF